MFNLWRWGVCSMCTKSKLIFELDQKFLNLKKLC